MKAEKNDSHVRYSQCDWGDLYYGTKTQLQNLGLGVNMAFPGEPGAPKKAIRLVGPGNAAVRITTGWDRESEIFTAYVHFSGWPERPGYELEWNGPALAGIQSKRQPWYDEHIGSAADLAAAGLVAPHLFPGMPGMRKVRATILADGTPLGGAPTANHRSSRDEGARWIEKISASKYRLCVVISKEESRRRRAILDAESDQWKCQVQSLPRPPRLTEGKPTAEIRRGHLRLVWSAQ